MTTPQEALAAALDVGIYPAATPDGPRTPWQDGWNAGVMAVCERVEAALSSATPAPERPAWVGVPDANGDIHCSRLAPKRCMWVEGHYGGCATP